MKRKNGIIIAIDGPAGAGKSSVGKLVANEIGYKFISSGKMYRAIAWLCAKNSISLEDEEKVLIMAKENPISFDNEMPEPSLIINSIKLDRELYDEKIATATSFVARLLKLREFLVKEQRRIGTDGGIIMEGRDITTNVFPDAELKIYLDASPQARAERRVSQLKEEGIEADYNQILEMIIKRDEQDAKRQYNPLKRSLDSHYIDTTGITKEKTSEIIVNLFKKVIKEYR